MDAWMYGRTIIKPILYDCTTTGLRTNAVMQSAEKHTCCIRWEMQTSILDRHNAKMENEASGLRASCMLSRLTHSPSCMAVLAQLSFS